MQAIVERDDDRPVHDIFDELHQLFLPDAWQELTGTDVAG
jgi:hypothetical protein